VRGQLREAGIDVVRRLFHAPNANAHAERFVRSIKHECLNQLIPLGAHHFRRTIAEFVEHYHRERNHQGLANELIEGMPTVMDSRARIRCRQRLGGLLNYYSRAA
jgi:putative transposase